MLPLPQGPDLAGVAARLTEAELRLILVNPRLRDAASPMPAYHHVDLARARRAPGFRQPWLSPAQLEDVLAYLLTLDAPPEDTE
jgi:sulfur-oxidizing protein SoxX